MPGLPLAHLGIELIDLRMHASVNVSCARARLLIENPASAAISDQQAPTCVACCIARALLPGAPKTADKACAARAHLQTRLSALHACTRAWWLLCVMMPCLRALSSSALRSRVLTLSSSVRIASACRARAVASSRLLSTCRCAEGSPKADLSNYWGGCWRGIDLMTADLKPISEQHTARAASRCGAQHAPVGRPKAAFSTQ